MQTPINHLNKGLSIVIQYFSEIGAGSMNLGEVLFACPFMPGDLGDCLLRIGSHLNQLCFDVGRGSLRSPRSRSERCCFLAIGDYVVCLVFHDGLHDVTH